jgi:pilus assembly protein FimV
MGQELLPSHPLFGENLAPIQGVEGEMTVDQVPPSELDELANLDLDLDADISEMPSELGDASVLDLSSLPKAPSAATPSAGKPTAPTPLEQESEFSLNLDDLSSLEDIDLGDLGLDTEGSLMTKDSQGIDRLSSNADSSSPLLGMTEEEEIPAISLEELDHLGMGTPAPKSKSGGQPMSGRPETLDIGGDVETKLDLARAYLEMGDGEGAREILQEVLMEGNQAQQRTARDLLAQAG